MSAQNGAPSENGVCIIPWLHDPNRKFDARVDTTFTIGCPWGLEHLVAAEVHILLSAMCESARVKVSADTLPFEVCPSLLGVAKMTGEGGADFDTRPRVKDCPGVVPFKVATSLLFQQWAGNKSAFYTEMVRQLRLMRATECVGQCVGGYSTLYTPSAAESANTPEGFSDAALQVAKPLLQMKKQLFDAVEGPIPASLLRNQEDGQPSERVLFRAQAQKQVLEESSIIGGKGTGGKHSKQVLTDADFTQKDFSAAVGGLVGEMVWSVEDLQGLASASSALLPSSSTSSFPPHYYSNMSPLQVDRERQRSGGWRGGGARSSQGNGGEDSSSDSSATFQWEVNLLYFNTDIVATYHRVGIPPSPSPTQFCSTESKKKEDDEEEAGTWYHVVLSVVLHEPNLPRMEKGRRDGGIEEQHDLWRDRRKIRQQLLNCEVAPRDVVHSVPGPASFKNEVRVSKGMNAMNPVLGHALCFLAQITDGDVVCDPMGGCGSTLVEALLYCEEQRRISCLRIGTKNSSPPGSARGSSPPSRHSPSSAPRITVISGEMEHRFGVALAAQNLLDGGALTKNAELLDLPFTKDLEGEEQRSERMSLGMETTYQNGRVYQGVPSTKTKKLRGRKAVATPKAEVDQQQGEQQPSRMLQSWGSTAVVRWNAMKIPLRDNSVDIIVSDLPFGARCGNHDVNTRVYPALMRQFWRVLRKRRPSNEPPFTSTNASSPPLVAAVNRPVGQGRLVVLTIEVELVLELASITSRVQSAPPEQQQKEPQAEKRDRGTDGSVCVTTGGEGAAGESENTNELQPLGEEERDGLSKRQQRKQEKDHRRRRVEKKWPPAANNPKFPPWRLVMTPFRVDMSGQYPYIIVLDPLPLPAATSVGVG